VNKGRQRLRFRHARIAHLAHRPVGGATPITRGCSRSGSVPMADMTARNWVVLPTPA
jgi:hypothetical protein